jgi:hypothetical protein
VFGPVESIEAVENIEEVEDVEIGAAREQPASKKPAGRGRTLAGLEPPPPTADGHNTSLDINTEDGGDQGREAHRAQGPPMDRPIQRQENEPRRGQQRGDWIERVVAQGGGWRREASGSRRDDAYAVSGGVHRL